MISKLEDIKGYSGVYNEVYNGDCYKIKTLPFKPDVIFDFGANVGCFTRLCHETFPDAKIIAVEPDGVNYDCLTRFNHNKNTVYINKAIGEGKMWKILTAESGTGEMYLNSGEWFPETDMIEREKYGGLQERVSLECVMPDELINQYTNTGDKYLVKIDIEGNEHIIFSHEKSMDAIRGADYICMEIHLFTLGDIKYDKVKDEALKMFKTFEETHDCIIDGGTEEKRHFDFWATKKQVL